MSRKYGSSELDSKRAIDRTVEILGLLTDRLAESAGAGHRYLMGPELTAVDLYWATFCNLVSPLPQEQMPIAPAIRAMFASQEPEILAALDPALLAHRDFIYETYLELPVEV